MTKKEIKFELTKLLDNSFALLNNGPDDEAASQAKQMAKLSPELFQAFLHGGKAWSCGTMQEANDCFRKITESIPESSFASLCVFHTHWKMGEYESALREIRRFQQTGKESEDYNNIISGLQEQGIIEENINLLEDPSVYYEE